MRDQQQSHVQLRPQVVQQLQDLRLDGDVQRGGRFVGHQQRGLAGDGGGDQQHAHDDCDPQPAAATATAAGGSVRAGVAGSADGGGSGKGACGTA
ncbi:hypothetical protein G6F54_014120 [Rhizopus delemar]|nr:hypothetical protein G6F54_014120 [Rhizopus delemar]